LKVLITELVLRKIKERGMERMESGMAAMGSVKKGVGRIKQASKFELPCACA
jgi:hypothetical protein